MGNRRGYSDEEKAAALACLDANGGNVYRTAGQLGIPDSTLDGWAKERGTSPAVPALRERKKGTLAEKFAEFAHKALDIANDDIGGLEKEKPLPRILAAAAATDKHRLLTEKPTAIHEHREAHREAALRAFEIYVRLRQTKSPTLTREELAIELCEHRPEFKPLLLPAAEPSAD